MNWPAQFYLDGWLLKMTNGGELTPHMHEKGWISGAVYINVPKKTAPNSGNFVVCLDDHRSLGRKLEHLQEIIEVRTGSLVFFPSSLMHYTIPFKSSEDRITLAFDVVPR